MSDLFTDVMLLKIAENTSTTSKWAAAPEFEKEAYFIANSLYADEYKKSSDYRHAVNFSMLLLGGAMYTCQAPWMLIIAIFPIWILIISGFRKRAKIRAMNEAWKIVKEKIAKETVIREALYQRATNNLKMIEE